MKFSFQRLSAVLRKELREYRRSPFIVGTMAVLPLVFLIEPLIVIFRLGPTVGASAVDKAVGSTFLLLLIAPALLPAVIAAYSVVGEREQGTLEPLLTTPLRREELLLGKALGVVAPAVVIAYVLFALVQICARLFASRHRDGVHKDPLFRIQPERWLESEFRAGLSDLLPSLRGEQLYSQVPALSSGDRGMLDLLTLDRNGRLVVIELKADEDLHLPLQALDYWIRVRVLNAGRQRTAASDRPLSAFEREGYFPETEISPLSPRLLLAAPALRIHPANLPVLRYFSPDVDWEFIALSEHWRQQLQIVFRKRSTDLDS